MKRCRKEHTISLILLSLASSTDVFAFAPASVPGRPAQTLPSGEWRRSDGQIRTGGFKVIATRMKSATVGNVLEDVDGIGEASNQEDELSGRLPIGPGEVPPPILDLTEQIDIAQVIASTTLSSSGNIGADIFSDDSVEAEILVNQGRNNIIEGPNEVPQPSLELAEREEEGYIETPGVMKIMKFAIPAVGVWLCGPMLSLIDTSTVGLLSGTAQQAALGPAVAVADYSALLLAFMYTATTNLISAAQETDRGIEGKPRTTRTLISSLQLSGYVGSAIGASLIILARVALRAIIGNDTIDPEVFTAAMKYLRIRALGMPAAAFIGAAQSACLGMKDIKSPLYVLLTAAVVNFFGDMAFVSSSHPWIGGAAGAAWATIFSQYAAVFIFTKWLRNKPKSASVAATSSPHESDEQRPETVNISNAILELTGPASSPGAMRRHNFREKLKSLKMSRKSRQEHTTNIFTNGRPSLSDMVRKMKRSKSTDARREGKGSSDDTFSARGFLEGKMRFRDVFSLPSKEEAMEFWPYVLPVTATSVGRVSGYVAMSHVVSSSIGTIAMAAQQIVLSFFYCLCPLADSLNLTAQSFVPTLYAKKKSMQRTKALHRITTEFWRAGLLMGSACVGAIALLPFLSRFFTGDVLVMSEVNTVVPFLSIFFAVHGVFSATEGILLGQRDLGFLGKSYAAFFFAVPWFMLQVKKTALSGVGSAKLTSVWKVFTCYQLFRTVSWLVRIMRLNIKSKLEITKNADETNIVSGDSI
mmetsp:Transcript_68362/g.101539  ORF Transcript_68362/g.101539 Transcript_68362/m.101539 type:complete len:756 (+) Transcript_68362:98-2365(+)